MQLKETSLPSLTCVPLDESLKELSRLSVIGAISMKTYREALGVKFPEIEEVQEDVVEDIWDVI